MSNIEHVLTALRRPKLLIRAARHGVETYNRSAMLRRLLRTDSIPGSEVVLERLVDQEAQLEDARQGAGAKYSFERHIELLVAIMAEARLLPRNAKT